MTLRVKIINFYSDFTRNLERLTFNLWQRLGFHVVLVNWLSSLPDTSKLNESVWKKRNDLCGINIDGEKQLKLLSTFVSMFKNEFDSFALKKPKEPFVFYYKNNNFSSFDAEIFYSMVRFFKPRKIMEIGSGSSTLLAAKAIVNNKNSDENYNCKLIAVDPYADIKFIFNFPGFSKLIPKPAQDIPLAEFEDLGPGDILFIDSSHILKIGSDLHYLLLSVLPRLKKGVFVHFHDILWPFEYPKEWIIKRHWFVNEQYFLQGFLTFNDKFEVIWASSFMLDKYPDEINKAFVHFKSGTQCSSSFWIRRTSE